MIRRTAEWALRVLIGVKRGNRSIEFDFAKQHFRCIVPDDSLWGAVTDVLLTRSYERASIKLPSSGVVIDAGAHVGLFTIAAHAAGARVVAVEPDRGNLELLMRNIEDNSIEEVEVVRAALSGSTGTTSLATGKDSVSHKLGQNGEGSQVQTISLDDLLQPIETVQLLKLDIEGAEFDALEKASDESLGKIQTIVAELHLRANTGRGKVLAERLRSLGFSVRLLGPSFYYYKQPLKRLFVGWKAVKGLSRLKVAVFLSYTAVGLLSTVLPVRRKLNTDGLMFLFAQKL